MARRHPQLTAYLIDPGGIQTDFAAKAGDPEFLAMTREHWDHMVTADQAAADVIATLMRPDLVGGAVYARGEETPFVDVDERLADLVYDRTAEVVFAAS